MIADESLNYWADRFVEARLADVMSLEQFLGLSTSLRERRITQHREVRMLQERIEHLHDDMTAHGERLIAPIRRKASRRPWWWRRWRVHRHA